MFSTLNQGSLIYILDKTDTPQIKIGEVTANQPTLSSTGGYLPNSNCNIKVKIDGAIYDYSNIPAASTIVTYNNGKIILSETKQGLQTEVESMLQSSRDIVNNLNKYKNNIVVCENLLKDLNPQYAKDKARDEQISKLETKVSTIGDKLDKVLEAINNKIN